MSLVGGWDKERPGELPRDFRDYEDPSKIGPKNRHAVTATRVNLVGGRPSLERTSCPPIVQAKALPTTKHKSSSGPATPKTDGGGAATTNPVHITLIKHRPDLARTSYTGSPGSPRSPRSAPHTSPMKGGFFSRLLHEDTSEDATRTKERWCERVDSGCLNVHPDEPADLDAWRHGSFKPDDPAHSMHTVAGVAQQPQPQPQPQQQENQSGGDSADGQQR